MFVECACQKWNQNSSYSCSTRCIAALRASRVGLRYTGLTLVLLLDSILLTYHQKWNQNSSYSCSTRCIAALRASRVGLRYTGLTLVLLLDSILRGSNRSGSAPRSISASFVSPSHFSSEREYKSCTATGLVSSFALIFCFRKLADRADREGVSCESAFDLGGFWPQIDAVFFASHIEPRLCVLSIRLGSYLDVSDTPFKALCFVILLQSALQLATRKRKTNNPVSILWSDCRRWFSQTLQLTCFLQFPWLDVILIFVLPSTPFSLTGRGAGTKGNGAMQCATH